MRPMTPPEAQGTRQTAEAPAAPPAVSVCVPAAETLRKRAQFLKAASARRQGTAGFLLAGPRPARWHARRRRRLHRLEEDRQCGVAQPRQAPPARSRPRGAARASPTPAGTMCWSPGRRRPSRAPTPTFCADLEIALRQIHGSPGQAMTPLAHILALPVRAYRLLLQPLGRPRLPLSAHLLAPMQWRRWNVTAG